VGGGLSLRVAAAAAYALLNGGGARRGMPRRVRSVGPGPFSSGGRVDELLARRCWRCLRLLTYRRSAALLSRIWRFAARYQRFKLRVAGGHCMGLLDGTSLPLKANSSA